MSTVQAMRIPRVDGLCAEQIDVRGAEGDGDAALMDQFGRLHALTDPMILGRDPGDTGLAILESSVSRRHAELFQRDGAWWIRDLRSTNGTYIEGQELEGETELQTGQLIVLGDVGFVFYAHADGETAVRNSEEIRVTAASRNISSIRLKLREPRGGGGGEVEFGGEVAQLGVSQFALIRLLARRREHEASDADEVRGFIASSELIATLPWTTPYPTDNHLKQLVRRVRRALERIGLADVIESRQRFGYRLLVDSEFDVSVED